MRSSFGDGRLGAQIIDRAEALAQRSDSADALTVAYLTPAHRAVSAQIERTSRVSCAPCSEALSAQLAAAVGRAGVRPFRLPSGAGHDAMMLARLTEVAMLFVRCDNGGVSHSPREQLDAADADLAAQVFADFLRSLG